MIVQWCIKGLALDDDDAATDVIDSRHGLSCSWWRQVHWISPPEIRAKLTADNLNRHVNHFEDIDPATGDPFCEQSPFISLSAGVVERSAALQTNYVRRARSTALWFGSDFGRRRVAYLYTCWVVLAPRPSVEIESVAEEIRDLNAYRRYSPFQPEGEVTAKVIVPDNQIESCERWDRAGQWARTWRHANPRFSQPAQLSNVRELL